MEGTTIPVHCSEYQESMVIATFRLPSHHLACETGMWRRGTGELVLSLYGIIYAVPPVAVQMAKVRCKMSNIHNMCF